MRVVSGSARGIKLEAVPGETTRPILDRVKTALFDTIRPDIEGTRWLDLFAGSGSVGIEALSQGAQHCTFLDIAPKAIETIKNNLEKTKFSTHAVVRNVDGFAFLRRSPETFDVIFIAPPQYEQLWSLALQHVAERPELCTGRGKVIVQIDPKEYEALDLTDFVEEQVRTYGNTQLLFFRKR